MKYTLCGLDTPPAQNNNILSTCVFELRFYIPLDTKRGHFGDILASQPISWLGTEKLNLIQPTSNRTKHTNVQT